MSIISNQQFIRVGELIVGKRVKNAKGPVEPQKGLLIKNRIKFNVEKTDTSEPNKAKIEIFNLSQLTRNFLEEKDLIVFLKCGYLGNVQTLFFGDVIRPSSKREGADVVTSLECGDAFNTIQNAYIELGLAKGANNRQIIDQAISLLNVSLFIKDEIPLVVYEQGFSYSGRVKELLNDLMKQVGLEWNIQDGELQILRKSKTTTQRAVVVSPDTGLIGFPTKTKEGLEFECLINPQIRPARACQLISKQFFSTIRQGSTAASQSLVDSGGTVKVTKCEFNGDTYEGDWKVKVQGTIPGIIEAEQKAAGE